MRKMQPYVDRAFARMIAYKRLLTAASILDDTPPMMATMRFQALNLNGDEYRPLDGAPGSIVVDSAADGTRTVHVDLQVIRYSYHL